MQWQHSIRHGGLALALAGAVLAGGCNWGDETVVIGGGGANVGVCNQTGAGINREAAMQKNCPALSDYRLFTDPANPLSDPKGNGMRYRVTTLLFSNYASKSRVMYIPTDKAVKYQEDTSFHFPVGTIIAKTFYFNRKLDQESSKDIVIETRLLIHRENGWAGLPYVWNNGEATLQEYGSHVTVDVISKNGNTRTIPYDIPSMQACGKCHRGPSGNKPDYPIGPKARYLNYSFTYNGKKVNQLVHMIQTGRLKGAPPRSEWPSAPSALHSNASVDSRARAYLDANCGYCHRPAGYASVSGLYMVDDFEKPQKGPNGVYYGICKTPTSAGRGTGYRPYDIWPGKPKESILMYRIQHTGPGLSMPPLAHSVVDKEGVQLIRKWIKQLPGSCKPPVGS